LELESYKYESGLNLDLKCFLFFLVIVLLLFERINYCTDLNCMFDRRIVIKLLITYFQRNHSKEVWKSSNCGPVVALDASCRSALYFACSNHNFFLSVHVLLSK